MKSVKRGMVIDINLNPVKGSETGKIRPCIVVTNDVYNQNLPVIQVVPITSWNEKKSQISTNVFLEPSKENGLTKKSIADCLQTRPIDYQHRLVKIRGQISPNELIEIDRGLKLVFGLF
ncbi:MAG: type II toxin-antitoxin system PemK/MazF family toxin [Melioribacteraceae bacterium]|nr:type II toxin-antitoxin system PemK/MazF family toxin [Melioribacteraceae bacterium]MCF8353043.1 type II toxin-antitoxin system PemK/MazF family toxin [Melioribacteraceae bacterium]MCF8392934.1 type II toxin-antitoxin system PemK/MazF family toxin [Melioribacteraceae bacterium]MCF8417771.1 type II toxin-antitoxin system PemK/MazF family toxin [Melioribacteraceae bacterium]